MSRFIQREFTLQGGPEMLDENEEETLLADPSESVEGSEQLSQLVEPLSGGPDGEIAAENEHTSVP